MKVGAKRAEKPSLRISMPILRTTGKCRQKEKNRVKKSGKSLENGEINPNFARDYARTGAPLMAPLEEVISLPITALIGSGFGNGLSNKGITTNYS